MHSQASTLSTTVVTPELVMCSVNVAAQQTMSSEEHLLLSDLRAKRQAAEQVFRALERAEHAAEVATSASGEAWQHILCFRQP